MQTESARSRAYVNGLKAAERRGYSDGRAGVACGNPYRRMDHRLSYQAGWERGAHDREIAARLCRAGDLRYRAQFKPKKEKIRGHL